MTEIAALTAAECRFVSERLIEFNRAQVAFTQDMPFVHLAYGIKSAEDGIIAGITGVVYCWQCLAIETLWVDGRHRNRGYGAQLLERLECEARLRGCALAHLDTFDFQAKRFYLQRGYDVFGTLKDCPPGHERYYLRKTL